MVFIILALENTMNLEEINNKISKRKEIGVEPIVLVAELIMAPKVHRIL